MPSVAQLTCDQKLEFYRDFSVSVYDQIGYVNYVSDSFDFPRCGEV